jgi:hypothetical protein
VLAVDITLICRPSYPTLIHQSLLLHRSGRIVGGGGGDPLWGETNRQNHAKSGLQERIVFSKMNSVCVDVVNNKGMCEKLQVVRAENIIGKVRMQGLGKHRKLA